MYYERTTVHFIANGGISPQHRGIDSFLLSGLGGKETAVEAKCTLYTVQQSSESIQSVELFNLCRNSLADFFVLLQLEQYLVVATFHLIMVARGRPAALLLSSKDLSCVCNGSKSATFKNS